MTAFSFILEVIPLVIAVGAGAGSRRSLGTAVFGGMVAAAIFVPILVPMFFSVIQKTRETLKRTGNMENNKGLAGQSEHSIVSL